MGADKYKINYRIDYSGSALSELEVSNLGGFRMPLLESKLSPSNSFSAPLAKEANSDALDHCELKDE